MADSEISYGNDLSNVAKLFRLYTPSLELAGHDKHKIAYRKLYLEGIGTQVAEKDSLLGSGAGRGGTGVEERVGQAFQKILAVMNDLYQKHPDAELRFITFDIFGFSRGAAAARHFANHIAKGSNGFLGESLRRTKLKFSHSFVPNSSCIDMGFVGLFDTVASIVGWDNLGNLSSRHIPRLELYLNPNAIQNVVQLTARDEKRFNFALSEVSPDHLEINLPGVHSDIGGGYLPQSQETLMLTPMQTLDVPIDQNILETSIYRDAVEAKARWVAEGWPEDMLHIVTPEAERLAYDNQDWMTPESKRVYAGLQIRRHVRGELSRVYLRVMHSLATAKKVPFLDLNPRHPDFALPTELQPLCDKFIAGDYSISPAEDTLLRRSYIHTSAHWNHPWGNAKGRTITLLYLNSPMEDGVRVRHPHVHVPRWQL